MQKSRVFFRTLSYLGCVSLMACGGEDAQQAGQQDETGHLELAAVASSWNPDIELGANNNTWWIEVLTDDEQVAEVVAVTNEGESILLSPTNWGSFAANEFIARGTQVRLVLSREDGESVSTNEFRYLRDTTLTLDQSGSGENPVDVPTTETPTATYTVSGSKILDTCGQPVLLRGVNKMNVWTDPSGDSFPEIAKTGANTVRIVWSTSGTPSGLDNLIQRARDNGLLPMIELHDATGDLAGVPAMVNWWLRSDVVSLIAKHEGALLVNIANEAASWDVTENAWTSTYRTAIERMRNAGIRTPLVIDSRGWGHDTDLLLSHGPTLLDADPLKNIIFSTHQYRSSSNAGRSYWDSTFNQLAESGLAVVIGEFGNSTADCSVAADYKSLIEAANTYQLGWYAWSWGPGNTPCGGLDMTRDGKYSTLNGWGLEVASTHPASIKNTSKPARVSDSCR